MPLNLEIPDIKEVYVDELVERGEWLNVVIQTNAPWPVKKQRIVYKGETIWVVPIMKDHMPSLAMKLRKGQNRKDMSIFLMRFLSVLSWIEEKGYRTDSVGGGSMPFPTMRNRNQGVMLCEQFDVDYLPEPQTKEAELALALLREGRSLNHPGYAFLAFYRVLEVIFPKSSIRQSWIANNVDLMDSPIGNEALKRLKATNVPDIGKHLYESGRCAVAHASKDPVMDPDDPEDFQRLWQELPIMEGLAVHAIDTELGVKTPMRVYREHLYELEGFKRILGPVIVAKLQRGEELNDDEVVDLPLLSVRLKGKLPYPPLEKMVPISVECSGSLMQITLKSDNDLARFRFTLDFANERLLFDMFRDIGTKDDGSVTAAEAALEVHRFSDAYFGNGKLNIFDSETGELMSRKDAYLPMNMMFDFEKAAVAMAYREGIVRQRREFNERYSVEITRLSVRWAISVNLTIDLSK